MKRAFDAKELANAVAPWAFHDLRRTARSLMSWAGVTPTLPSGLWVTPLPALKASMIGIYEEKAHALNALAGLIENILAPTEDKVVKLRR